MERASNIDGVNEAFKKCASQLIRLSTKYKLDVNVLPRTRLSRSVISAPMVVKQVNPTPPAPSTASTFVVKEVKSKSGLKCTPVSKHLLFSPSVSSTPSAAVKAEDGDATSVAPPPPAVSTSLIPEIAITASRAVEVDVAELGMLALPPNTAASTSPLLSGISTVSRAFRSVGGSRRIKRVTLGVVKPASSPLQAHRVDLPAPAESFIAQFSSSSPQARAPSPVPAPSIPTHMSLLPVTGHTIIRKVVRAGMPVKANKPSAPPSRWDNDPSMPTTVLVGLRKVTAGVKGKGKAPSIPVSSISRSDINNRASALYSINIPLMAWIADKGFKSVIPDFDLFRSVSPDFKDVRQLMPLIVSNNSRVLKPSVGSDLERVFDDRDVKRTTSELFEHLDHLLCFLPAICIDVIHKIEVPYVVDGVVSFKVSRLKPRDSTPMEAYAQRLRPADVKNVLNSYFSNPIICPLIHDAVLKHAKSNDAAFHAMITEVTNLYKRQHTKLGYRG